MSRACASRSDRILIVEDDESLRVTLADVLREEGYRVAVARDVSSAEALLEGATFDVIVLDLMLPDGDGYGLCARLRERGNHARVLMLTARTLEDDLVRGFKVGADDYLKKPYRLRELLARVGALARRGSAASPGVARLRLGEHTIDKDACRVVDGSGQEVALTRTELDLLVLLVESAGHALSRNEILDRVWGRDVVVDARTIDNFVSSLKKKLRWGPGCGFSIRTVRGVG